MSQFLRVFQHLLPKSPAWRLSTGKTLTAFFAGLAGVPDAVRTYADSVFQDAFPDTTRQLPLWRTQFGLEPGANDAADQLQIATAWKSQGGQDPNYLQSILQGAGFPLYVHEWWTDDLPFAQVCCGDALAECGELGARSATRSYTRFVRDPRAYTLQPAIGSWECSTFSSQPECSALVNPPQCNAFLSNEPGYLVNLDLSRNAPPPIPDDSNLALQPARKDSSAWDWSPIHWPYFFYLGGATFPSRVSIPASRRAELERLVLKLRPTHQWVVMLVDYTGGASALVGSSGVQLVNDHGEGLNIG